MSHMSSPVAPAAPTITRLAAPLRQQVVDQLRRGIVTNHYPPGTRLVERVLCEDLQVSRTVIRESLRQLETEQLIEMVPNVGSVVRRLTHDEARNLYEVRAALESLAAADCAERASDDLLARLEAALAAVPDPGEGTVEERLVTQDLFVALLLEGSQNPVLADMVSTIHSRMSRLRALTLAHGGNERQKPGLTGIYHAVRGRDRAAAEAAMRDYVRTASEPALSALARDGNA